MFRSVLLPARRRRIFSHPLHSHFQILISLRPFQRVLRFLSSFLVAFLSARSPWEQKKAQRTAHARPLTAPHTHFECAAMNGMGTGHE